MCILSWSSNPFSFALTKFTVKQSKYAAKWSKPGYLAKQKNRGKKNPGKLIRTVDVYTSTLIQSTFYFTNLNSYCSKDIKQEIQKNARKHRSWRTKLLLLQNYTSDNTFFITLLMIQLLLFLASIHIPTSLGKIK